MVEIDYDVLTCHAMACLNLIIDLALLRDFICTQIINSRTLTAKQLFPHSRVASPFVCVML